MKTRTWCIVLLILLALPCASVHGQWKNVAPNLLGNLYPTGKYGFGGAICFKDGVLWAGKTNLWMSPDTGKTWTLKNANGFDSLIYMIDFIDKQNGLVSTAAGVLQTRDGGNTWKEISEHGNSLRIAFFIGSKETIVVNTYSDSVGLKISHDNGATWTTNTFGKVDAIWGMGAAGGTAYMTDHSLGSKRNASLVVTTDYGDSWRRMDGEVNFDSYMFAVDGCDPNRLYLVNENLYSSDNNCYIHTSTDKGQSWGMVQSKSIQASKGKFYYVGSIVTSRNAVFVQTHENGIERSIDNGITFTSIGGPSISADTRFVAALNENIVFAVDSNGSMWATFNGGGDSVIVPRVTPTVPRFSCPRVILEAGKDQLILRAIYLSKNTNLIASVDMIVRYPIGSLVFISAKSTAGKSIATDTSMHGRIKIHFNGDDIYNRTDSLVGHILFHYYPREVDCSIIHFDSVVTVMANTDCQSPASIITSFEGVIGTYKSCGLSAAGGDPILPTQSHFDFTPNPAHTTGTLISREYSGEIEMQIFDAKGALVRSLANTISVNAPLVIGLEGLSAGAYYMQITGRNVQAVVAIMVE